MRGDIDITLCYYYPIQSLAELQELVNFELIYPLIGWHLSKSKDTH